MNRRTSENQIRSGHCAEDNNLNRNNEMNHDFSADQPEAQSSYQMLSPNPEIRILDYVNLTLTYS